MPSPEPRTPPPGRRGAWGTTWRTLAMVAIGALLWAIYAATIEAAGEARQLWFVAADPLIGLLALVGALRYGRRAPVATGLLTAAAAAVSASAAGPATYLLGSVSTRRRWREIAAVGAANIASGVIVDRVYPQPADSGPWWVGLVIGLLVAAVIVAVGVAVGQRRELVAGLRERAETTEREQHAREDAARVAERNRIAREMHDVLAHRISLVAMHAGALSFRKDLSPQEQATAARTIEENAHLALQELRDVLGVLREPSAEDAPPERPQPLLTDLPDLLTDARAAGMRVDLEGTVTGTPSTTLSRTAYRVVQEGLTNARKHAPDTHVTVTVAGAAEEGLTVQVANPTPLRRGGAGMPGAGVGLLGLGERVDRVGGRITHGPGEQGGYLLAVWLPWSP